MPRRGKHVATEREKAAARLYKATHRDPAAHAEAERVRYYTRRGLVAPPKRQYAPREDRPPQPAKLPPLVEAPTGHDIYDEARAALQRNERFELTQTMDSTARDLLQEYALAALEGRDPAEAVQRFRRARAKDRYALVFGTATVTGLDR